MKSSNPVGTPRPLICCICGGGAGRFHQHWNRDEGWGICPSCVAAQSAVEDADTMQSLYGKVLVNYDQPMYRHLGRRYKVLAATTVESVANAYMTKHESASVLAVTDTGLIVLVDENDLGEELPGNGSRDGKGSAVMEVL